jgi:hypothetical protein
MSDKKPSTDIQAGVSIEPPAAGKVFPWLAERIQLTRIINAAVAWMNLSVLVKLKMPDGTTQCMPVVRPVITPNNSTLELPIDLSNFSGSGSGSGTVPFSGNGAPSASTLAAGSYVAGPVPSLYVDMTAKALYVCTTAGTAATSGWGMVASLEVAEMDGAPDVIGVKKIIFPAGAVTDNGDKSVNVQFPTPPAGGGGMFSIYSGGAYTQGSGVYVSGLGTFWATVNVPAGNAPAYPENSFWKLIAFDVQEAGICATGQQNIYINASAPF